MDSVLTYRESLHHAITGLQCLRERAGQATACAIDALYACRGRIACIGMGKCGLIARKTAATFASTGTPAFYLHPAEAVHGDLGFLSSEDGALVFSNSGETAEILTLLPHLQARSLPIIAVTGRPASSLGRSAHLVLDSSVPREADPLNMAPTASATAMLALGDALAAALMERRGFTKEDYAQRHPGGNLGRRLLCRVDELMHTGPDLPLAREDDVLRDALCVMSSKRLGALFIINAEYRLSGVFTDGDLRRLFQQNAHPLDCYMRDVMTRNYRHIPIDTLAADALRHMEDNLITILPVLYGEELRGALHIHDIIRAGIQ